MQTVPVWASAVGKAVAGSEVEGEGPSTVAVVVQVGSVSTPDNLQASYRTLHMHLGWSCNEVDPGGLGFAAARSR